MPDEYQDDETGEPLLRDEALARIAAIRARLDPPQLVLPEGEPPPDLPKTTLYELRANGDGR